MTSLAKTVAMMTALHAKSGDSAAKGLDAVNAILKGMTARDRDNFAMAWHDADKADAKGGLDARMAAARAAGLDNVFFSGWVPQRATAKVLSDQEIAVNSLNDRAYPNDGPAARTKLANALQLVIDASQESTRAAAVMAGAKSVFERSKNVDAKVARKFLEDNVASLQSNGGKLDNQAISDAVDLVAAIDNGPAIAVMANRHAAMTTAIAKFRSALILPLIESVIVSIPESKRNERWLSVANAAKTAWSDHMRELVKAEQKGVPSTVAKVLIEGAKAQAAKLATDKAPVVKTRDQEIANAKASMLRAANELRKLDALSDQEHKSLLNSLAARGISEKTASRVAPVETTKKDSAPTHGKSESKTGPAPKPTKPARKSKSVVVTGPADAMDDVAAQLDGSLPV